MRIDNWPLDRIMRLPDWCFGRRWWVGATLYEATGSDSSGIAEEQLPDKFVVWGVLVSVMSPNCLEAIQLTIRLSDRALANIGQAAQYDRLFKNIGTGMAGYELYLQQNGVTWITAERQLIESAGRRLAFVALGDGAIRYDLTAGVLISSLPKEVPDWLISGQAANQF